LSEVLDSGPDVSLSSVEECELFDSCESGEDSLDQVVLSMVLGLQGEDKSDVSIIIK
jgi:hypothetical protein